jgi:hypothetical protein
MRRNGTADSPWARASVRVRNNPAAIRTSALAVRNRMNVFIKTPFK